MTYLLFLLALSFYLFFQSNSIYGGDAGDLVSSAYTFGVAHPPGYPLYTALGNIFTRIPVNTIAWRMGLLSSIPASLAIVVLFILLRKILRNTSSALLGVCTFALTYIYWLYAITPEVFALHIFFLIALFWLLWEFHTSGSIKFLYLFALFAGLSLAHHHIIIFTYPAFMYLFFKSRPIKKIPKIVFGKLFAVFIIGLSPYLYVVYAARAHPMINWNEPYTLPGLVKLMTRSTYGTFQSGPLAGQSLISRFLEIPAVFDFLISDFTIWGVLIAIIGSAYLYKINRTFFNYTSIAFVSVSFFYFFYAFYPVDNPFAIATLERFLLPGYLFFTIFLSAGVAGLSHALFVFFRKKAIHITPMKQHLYTWAIFGFLPLILLYINYPKLSVLKHDLTAENHGMDILSTTQKGSILFLQRDSTLFDTQYVYFTQHTRQDIIPIHYYRFYNGDLFNALHKHYPDLKLPRLTKEKLLQAFVDNNYSNRPIYSNLAFSIKDYTWVRYGLLYRLYKNSELPTVKTVLAQNDKLWEMYSDPLSGSLGSYRNLMLANILDFYKEARLDGGLMQYDAKNYTQALSYFSQALRFNQNDTAIYYHQGRTLSALKKCSKAKQTLLYGIKKGGQKLYFYEAIMKNAQECFSDDTDAKIWKARFEHEKRTRQTKLKEL